MKEQCQCHRKLPFQIKMAFQPIVNVRTQTIFSYEALVRGEHGESASEVLGRIDQDLKYSFDQACRVKAIETFAALKGNTALNINFMPQAIYEPRHCLASTLKAIKDFHLEARNIIFEVTEQERVVSNEFLAAIFQEYRRQGFLTAIDDFGAGYAGLHLLSGFQPNIIKIDMDLIRNIDTDAVKQAIFLGIQHTCRALNIVMITEGVESFNEYVFLRDHGVDFMQGFLFARPALEQLPDVDWAVLNHDEQWGNGE